MEHKYDRLYSLGVPHNKFSVPLPDGSFYPDHFPVADARPLEFLTQYNRTRFKDWTDCEFLDLGCAEGSTTFGLSQMGSTVYGVEGRADGIVRAKAVAEILGFERTHFSVGNVVDSAVFRPVDGVFAAGILYHLEDPISFLVNCVKSAREFVYVDTGHAPRSEEEKKNSKFSSGFGRSHVLKYEGLELQAVDFAEPKDVSEVQSGQRRKPRSGIGNTNSVWIGHTALIDLMAHLGFPFYEMVRDIPIIPRRRTAFFRTEPRPIKKLELTRPLPELQRPAVAAKNARARDIDYLKRAGKPVAVAGHEPMLSAVIATLKAEGVEVGTVTVLPGAGGTPVSMAKLKQIFDGHGGQIVIALPKAADLQYRLMLLDRFDYVFTSLALAVELNGELAVAS